MNRSPSDPEVEAGRLGAQWLYAGKYKECTIKGHLIIAFHGLILAETIHLGVDHDVHCWDDVLDDGDIVMMPDEWGLGDKAYVGCEQILAGIKPEATHLGTFWSSIISFYRGRVEVVTVIAKLKKHAWCHTVHTAFLGRFKSLCTFNEITTVMTAIAIRRKIASGKPIDEVCGPWKHAFV